MRWLGPGEGSVGGNRSVSASAALHDNRGSECAGSGVGHLKGAAGCRLSSRQGQDVRAGKGLEKLAMVARGGNPGEGKK